MNLPRAFAAWLQVEEVGTFGTDLFVSRVPEQPSRAFWIKSNGGTPLGQAVTGQSRKSYVLELYHRDTDTEALHEQMEVLDDMVNAAGCSIELDGHNVIGISTNGPWSDQDLDDTERTVGLLQVNITIYKEI